jgi:hypothetical protein
MRELLENGVRNVAKSMMNKILNLSQDKRKPSNSHAIS